MSEESVLYYEYWDSHETIIKSKLWMLNDKLHREDGPAFTLYDNFDGIITCEEYHTNGLCNRIDGPAVIQYYDDGSIYKEVFFLNGQRYSAEEWFNHLSIKQKVNYLLNGA